MVNITAKPPYATSLVRWCEREVLQCASLLDYLRSILPKNARVGTVDNFQGQEAPIVLVSMVTSSAEYLPRNIEFFLVKID